LRTRSSTPRPSSWLGSPGSSLRKAGGHREQAQGQPTGAPNRSATGARG
jgi:hypothetical protein